MNKASGSNGMLLLLLSRFSCVRLCATPQTAAHQAPPSLGFSRQEHTEELYTKDLHNPDNHDGVITHIEPVPGMQSSGP